jgi:dTDP-glucose pyrophosphorylase
MGSPLDGKEMLIDPITRKPLIYWSVMKALRAGFDPILVLHPNKVKLKRYLIKEFGKRIKIFLHTPQPWEEWADSVLSVHKYWGKWNVIILPDTRFNEPLNILKDIKNIKKSDLVFYTHKVEDGSKFGVLLGTSNDIMFTSEKPRLLAGKPATAWGLIGFNKVYGYKLFKAYSVKNARLGLLCKTVIKPLEWFKDITRTGVLEEYPRG